MENRDDSRLVVTTGRPPGKEVEAISTHPRPSGPGVRLVWLSLDCIRPAPENELIYRPVGSTTPRSRSWPGASDDHGLREPIVVTRDGYILSGHRRHAACRLAGLRKVDCRVEDITRDDPEFETLLVEYNRQRVKSFDEVVREQVVTGQPGGRLSVAHRAPQGEVVGQRRVPLDRGHEDPEGDQQGQAAHARGRSDVYGKRDYWPLSDRSIHYDLLNDPPLRHAGKPGSRYRNDRPSYKDLRPADPGPARGANPVRGHRGPDANRPHGPGPRARRVHPEGAGQLPEGLLADLQQSQPNHVEIVGEKNTIEGSIRDVAAEYCIPYTSAAATARSIRDTRCSSGYKASGKDKLIILVLSDFDPEGEDIPHSFARSMRDDFGVTTSSPRRSA